MFSNIPTIRDVRFYTIQIFTTEGKRRTEDYTFFPPPPRQPATASNQQYLYRYAACIHTRALHIVMWRWRSDWMAHSINIENENLKQPGVRVKSIHI